MRSELTKKTIFIETSQQERSVETVDADWKDKYGLALLSRKKKKTFIQVKGVEIGVDFTEHSLSRIRWVDNLHLLVATYEQEEDNVNVFIIDLAGHLLHSFHGGESIQEIAVGSEGIWISYFDEGVFGSGISTEGLVLFDKTGQLLFRYHSDLVEQPGIADCYAICTGSASTAWLFPYTDFPLVEVNPKERTFRSYPVPAMLHGADAICVKGMYAYFFNPYGAAPKLYEWQIGTQEPLLLGTIQGTVRGLDPSEINHFISITDREVTLYQVIARDK